MHEVSVAQAIIERLREKLGDNYWRVRTVRLRVGRLSCINYDALQFAFEGLASARLCPKISVEIDWVEAKAKCGRCGHTFKPDDAFFLMCPQCGGRATLICGDELHLVEADLVDG